MWLIDADDAKRTYTQDMFDTEEDFERVNDVLDYAPTVDAVVVTRCKDCKHSTLPSALTQRYGVPGTLTCYVVPLTSMRIASTVTGTGFLGRV